MTTFSRALDSLWKVQEVDAQIADAQRGIEKAERALEKEQGKVAKAEAALKEAHEKLQQARAKEKEHEDELTRLDARVKQLEAQGSEAGDAAAVKQREKIDEIESAGIDLLTEIAKLEVNERTRKAELEAAQAVAEAQKDTTQTLVATGNELLDALNEQRAVALENVVPELLEVYEQEQAKHPGSALVEAKDKSCKGCSGELTLHLIQQIKLRAEIVRCPLCGRLLDSDTR